jgi:hypothetical protein
MQPFNLLNAMILIVTLGLSTGFLVYGIVRISGNSPLNNAVKIIFLIAITSSSGALCYFGLEAGPLSGIEKRMIPWGWVAMFSCGLGPLVAGIGTAMLASPFDPPIAKKGD